MSEPDEDPAEIEELLADMFETNNSQQAELGLVRHHALLVATHYNTLIETGISEDQSLELTAMYISSVFQRNSESE